MTASAYSIPSIDVDEVLRYLGHTDQEVPSELLERIDVQAARCLEVARPRGVVCVFDVADVQKNGAMHMRTDGDSDAHEAGAVEACKASTRAGGASTDAAGAPIDACVADRSADSAVSIAVHPDGGTVGVAPIRLVGTTLELPGTDIAAHLDGAVAVGVLAVTLGAGVDRELRLLAHTSALDQVVFDACATALVERAADAAEAQLVGIAAGRGLFLNWRYSPGYGDFGLDVQPHLLRALDAGRQAGIALTASTLLVPTKSVTAVAGLFATPQSSRGTLCPKCHCYEFCTIRTTGRTCRG